MPDKHDFFVTCPKGIEDLLLAELQELGIESCQTTVAGVSFSGELEQAYKVCLWSRLASRILLKLNEFDVETDDQLYKAISMVNWSQHLLESGTLAVSCNLSQSKLTNSHYAALKAKDAVVDQFNELYGTRPSVDRQHPDVRINLHIHRNRATLSLDLSGEPLHKRGYRVGKVAAPMKENLAAAILMRCGWPNESGVFYDLMCGSGTLLIEAALMALRIAPGINKDYFGFLNWKGHKADLWNNLVKQAETLKQENIATGELHIRGYDTAIASVKSARQNIQASGLQKFIQVDQRGIESCADPETDQPGLVVVNPPYGERLGEVRELAYLYADLGDCWKHHFGGWTTALFTGNEQLAKHIGLRSHKSNTLYNGPIKCKLLQYSIRAIQKDAAYEDRQAKDEESRQIISNRLKKNYKHLSRWAKNNGIECYRVYDADIPEYSAAIDIYGDWVHVQEYEAPATIDIRKVKQRLDHILDVIPEILHVDKKHIVVKSRRQQKGLRQYEKFDESRRQMVVTENGIKFNVNLHDYLDTGLFLDHRITREMIRDMAKDSRFLNLFAYTGSVSVYAAAGGAKTVTTIDMSNTYLGWAKRNFKLNGFESDKFRFIKADCVKWLKEQTTGQKKYDLIFIDPPTFSNSKGMEDVFDVQKDHVFLINAAMKLLDADGGLVFSNNFRRFKMDGSIAEHYNLEDITKKTIPEDYKRNQKIHNCWIIRHKS